MDLISPTRMSGLNLDLHKKTDNRLMLNSCTASADTAIFSLRLSPAVDTSNAK
jgi:hypothetical protein